jgi:LysM repeat protein
MHALVVKGVVAVAALAGSTLGLTQSQSAGAVAEAGTVSVMVVIPTYTVQPGDTLSLIAGRFCGNIQDYPALAAANGIADPNIIDVGQVIKLTCKTYTHITYTTPKQQAIQGGSNIAANGQADIPGTVPSVYSFYGLERLWVSAGGNPADQGTAACIAEHESGGRTFATGRQGERGLWQISPGHGPVLSTYDPIGNARAAVTISDNGTNWSQWTTAGSCGV